MVKRPDSSERISRRGVRFAAMVLAGILVGLAGVARGQAFSEFVLPMADSRPREITPGPDGSLWFTESYGNKIGRITTAGVVTEFTIPTFGGPIGITAGPDGALWFTENTGNKIGRITTAGVVTEFTIPTVRSFPVGITPGPDGALWFTEYAGDKIGRIPTAGVVTEFTTPTVDSFPIGITPGPDGALWFTEDYGNKIGRITTAGVVTEFAISTFSHPNLITAGPDGALWFAESGANKIGRITTAGVVTEFTISTVNDYPVGITAGPDGALWFTESGGFTGSGGIGGNKIGRITTVGVITEFPVPTANSGLGGIAAGPDGALWFTEFYGNKIGRITTSGATCASSATSLCLNDARFKVETTWTATDGASGLGQPMAVTADSGYFWFFSRNNVELVVKVLYGCSLNNNYWVFAAGLTNVNVVLKVTDIQTGQVKTYVNPQGTAFASIQDTSAFACP